MLLIILRTADADLRQLFAITARSVARYRYAKIMLQCGLFGCLVLAGRLALAQDLLANFRIGIRAEILPSTVIHSIALDDARSYEQARKLLALLRRLPGRLGFLLSHNRGDEQRESRCRDYQCFHDSSPRLRFNPLLGPIKPCNRMLQNRIDLRQSVSTSCPPPDRNVRG